MEGTPESRRELLGMLKISNDPEVSGHFAKFTPESFDKLFQDEGKVNHLFEGLKTKGLAQDKEKFIKDYGHVPATPKPTTATPTPTQTPVVTQPAKETPGLPFEKDIQRGLGTRINGSQVQTNPTEDAISILKGIREEEDYFGHTFHVENGGKPPEKPGLIQTFKDQWGGAKPIVDLARSGVNAVKGLFGGEPEPVQKLVQPLQFESDAQKEQSALSPVFQDHEAAKLPAIFQTKEAQRRTGLTPEQKQQAIEGSSGHQRAVDADWNRMSIGEQTMETAGDFASGVNRAVLKTPSGILKTVAQLGTGIENIVNVEDNKVTDDLLYQAADAYDKWLDESDFANTYIADSKRNSLSNDVGSGVGQILSMVGGGAGAKTLGGIIKARIGLKAGEKLASKPTVMKSILNKVVTPEMGIAFTQIFSSEYDNMIQRGESDKNAFKQALAVAGFTAPTETIPLWRLAERIEKILGPKFVKRMFNAVSNGAEEDAQERLQQTFSNVSNNQMVELEKNLKEEYEGVGRAGKAGGIVGFLAGLLAPVSGRRRVQAPPTQLGGQPTIPAPTPRKSVLPDGSVTYSVGSEAEIPDQFRDRAKQNSKGTMQVGRNGPVQQTATFSFTLTPEESAEYETQDVQFEDVSDPTGDGVVAPVVEEVTVDDQEWQSFQNDGTIDPMRLQGIVEDVKAGIPFEQMEPRYQAIVQAAMPQVNEILKNETNTTSTPTTIPSDVT